MDEPEYEGGSFPRFVLAGAAAGSAEHLVMFPVDTIKTHMQALRSHLPVHKSMVEASRHILKTDGAIGFFRGVTAMALGAAPAHGLYFATYEMAKIALGAAGPGNHPVETSIAGALATSVADFAQTPLDVVKQRLQLDAQKYGGGVFRCFSDVYKTEGLKAFWLSYPTTLVMNVPFHATQFTIYELVKDALSSVKALQDSAGNPVFAVHFAAGALAGGIAAAATTPLDVAKTRLQTQTEAGRAYLSMGQTLRHVWRTEGSRGLVAGIWPRFWFHMPSTAICWTVYEVMKRMLDV